MLKSQVSVVREANTSSVQKLKAATIQNLKNAPLLTHRLNN